MHQKQHNLIPTNLNLDDFVTEDDLERLGALGYTKQESRKILILTSMSLISFGVLTRNELSYPEFVKIMAQIAPQVQGHGKNEKYFPTIIIEIKGDMYDLEHQEGRFNFGKIKPKDEGVMN